MIGRQNGLMVIKMGYNNCLFEWGTMVGYWNGVQ